jgi:phage terminase Nu1 subunit (DNA packaging protein)
MAQVNKRELCRILGCAATTLDNLMARYGAEFPVIERGSHGRDYAFDPEAVTAFLSEKKAERERNHQDRLAELEQLDLPVEGLIGTHPTTTLPKPRDRLDTLRAQQLERQMAREAGLLVETGEVRRQVGGLLQRFVSELQGAIRNAGRAHNVPDAVIRAIEVEFDRARQRFCAELERFGGPKAETAVLEFTNPRAAGAAPVASGPVANGHDAEGAEPGEGLSVATATAGRS